MRHYRHRGIQGLRSISQPAIYIAGASSILGAINFITTIFNMRAPGMTMHKMPLFVWSVLVTAFPVAVIASRARGSPHDAFDGSQFRYDIFQSLQGGGDPVLYQHLFWFFGHPEVYIMVLPGFGIVSQVVSTFSRKAHLRISRDGLRACCYRLHRFRCLGPPYVHGRVVNVDVRPTSPSASMVIAVPTGIKIFSWIATMWGGSIQFRTPMLWAVGFVFVFTIGGVTGVVLANPGAHRVMQDTYYVVAHFHYVLSLGAVFAIFAGWYYWFPKITGYMYSEAIGKMHFWITFIGVNFAFFPQHFLGLAGMPRRVVDYPDAFPVAGITSHPLGHTFRA